MGQKKLASDGLPKVNPMLTPGKKPWHKGRKPVSEDAGGSAVLQARVGQRLLDGYREHLGPEWLRATIETAVIAAIAQKAEKARQAILASESISGK